LPSSCSKQVRRRRPDRVAGNAERLRRPHDPYVSVRIRVRQIYPSLVHNHPVEVEKKPLGYRVLKDEGRRREGLTLPPFPSFRCNTAGTRTWSEVPILYAAPVSNEWSGGIACEPTSSSISFVKQMGRAELEADLLLPSSLLLPHQRQLWNGHTLLRQHHRHCLYRVR